MEPAAPDVPPSPPRWSRIPFDILEDAQKREKRVRAKLLSPKSGITDLPEPILALVFSCISDPRTRNSMALVCMEWYSLERATRTKLCLRGCVSDLHLIPRSFQGVECLDLSHCSPWGYSLFQSAFSERAVLVGQVLRQAFPRVRYMTIYVRDARDIDMVALFWPDVQSLKLVRWHQRSIEPEEASGFGMEFRFLMQSCKFLKNLDLSEFYCWTEDIPPALMVEPRLSRNLCSLNLLKVSVEGFKASELEAIANACTNLEELRVVLVFDPRLFDFVDDDTLLHVGTNCKKLRVLHLVDNVAFGDLRGDPEEDFGDQDAKIGKPGLQGLFQALPLLEDLAIVLSQNVRDSRPIFEALAQYCKRLTSLSLDHFHGLCRGPQPDGIALCLGLTDLTIKSCADLNDNGLMAIASGCSRLCKLGLRSCKKVSRAGLCRMTRQLRQSLVDVQVTCCMQMNVVDILWALQPIQATIRSLEVEFVADPDLVARELDGKKGQPPPLSSTAGVFKLCGDDRGRRSHALETFDLNLAAVGSEGDAISQGFDLKGSLSDGWGSHTTSSSGSLGEDFSSHLPTRFVGPELGDEPIADGALSLFHSFREQSWSKLRCLSLWVSIGELLSPLPIMGLQFCPSLQEVQIRVQGDCRACRKPEVRVSGISTLALYPSLAKLTLDCSEMVGYALSAPQGHWELSLWERWYLQGVDLLRLRELDYWPPQDRDANRRGLSLPSAGLIAQCSTLRKLILHGTINEHLLRMFLKILVLRDVQLRLDYYPAPEVELNTETRADACRRFEAALMERGFPD